MYASSSRGSSSLPRKRRRKEKGDTDGLLTSLFTSIEDLRGELLSLRSTQSSCHQRLNYIEQQDLSGVSCRNAMLKPLPTATDCCHEYAESQFPTRLANHWGCSTPAYQPPLTNQDHLKFQRFSGQAEDWQVWFAKFSILTARFCFNEEDKLTELLQLLDGHAAEFVFMHLPAWILHDYQALTYEIGMRFRVVQAPKVFAAKYSHRDQQPHESLEAYAAELKSLYHKAFPKRSQQTRQEDLLQRFLDGLLNQEARARVEYHKAPVSIDEAVYHLAVLGQLAADCQQYSLNIKGPLLVA